MCHAHTAEYPSTTKSNEVLIPALTLYQVGEVSHKRLHTTEFPFYEKSGIGKSTHRQYISSCQGLGRRRNWGVTANGYGGFFGSDENVLK